MGLMMLSGQVSGEFNSHEVIDSTQIDGVNFLLPVAIAVFIMIIFNAYEQVQKLIRWFGSPAASIS